MTPEGIAKYLKVDVPSHYGRRIYAVVGSYQQLSTVEKALIDAELPEPVRVNLKAMESIGDERLEGLTKLENLKENAIRDALKDSYIRIIKQHQENYDLLILKDFELLFQYGVDLNVARNYVIGGKAIVMLVPGCTAGKSIFAYANSAHDGHEFFTDLFEQAHILEVD